MAPGTEALEFTDQAKMLAARRALQNAGVPCRINETRHDSSNRFTLEPVFERQLDDALALLRDPEHRVRRSLDDAEARQARLIIAREQQGNVLKLAVQLMQVVSIGLLLALLLFGLLSAFGD